MATEKTNKPTAEKAEKTALPKSRKVEFEKGQVGVNYIAEKVGCTPFQVREYLRANVRDMSQLKGKLYKFTLEEANRLAADIKAKASAPRATKAKAPGEKKAKAAKPVETVEAPELDEIEAELEDLDDLDMDIDEVDV